MSSKDISSNVEQVNDPAVKDEVYTAMKDAESLTPLDSPLTSPVEVEYKGLREPGFMGFYTNGFDRIFIAVIFFVAFHLLWMRFVEQFIPLFVGTIITIIIGVIIYRWG